MNPLMLSDFYKTDHRRQYPEGTENVYSNWTPRASRIPGIEQWIITNPTGASGRMLKHQWAREHDGMLVDPQIQTITLDLNQLNF